MKKNYSNRRRKDRITESEKQLLQEVTLSPLNNFLFTLGIIFIAELVVLLLIGNMHFQSKPVESFISALVITGVAAPLLWKTLVLPFRKLLDSAEGKAKREVRERDASLRAIFEFAPVGIIRMNRIGHFTQINPKFSEQLGIPISSLMEHTYASVLGLNPTGVPNETPDDFKKLMGSGGSSLCFDRSVASTAGHIAHFQITLCSIKGQNGDLNDVIGIVVDKSDVRPDFHSQSA